MTRKLIGLVLFAFIMLSSLAVLPSASGEEKQVIAGYGPVYGNLTSPYACEIVDNTIFVLDAYGLSAFSLPDNQFIARYPVDLVQAQSYQAMRDPKTWINFIKGISNMDSAFGNLLLRTITPTSSFLVNTTIEKDSSNHLFISAGNGITHLNTEGETVQLIPYPTEILPTRENEQVTVVFAMGGDMIYLLVQTNDISEEVNLKSQYIYTLDKEGNVQRKIELEADDSMIMDAFYSFKVLHDKQLFLLTKMVNGDTLYLFDQEGNLAYNVSVDLNESLISSLDLMTEDTLVCQIAEAGNFSIKNVIKQGKLIFQENEVTLEWGETWKDKNWGMLGISMSTSQERIGFVCTGKMESLMDYQVNMIDLPKTYYTIGKPINEPGQIYQSLSYAVDDEGNLYTTNLGSSVINVFNPKGEFQKSIEIDRAAVSSMMGIMEIMPLITDMFIETPYLYVTNLLPNTIARYDIKEDSWENLYESDMMSNSLNVWLDMYVEKEVVYLLDPVPDENGMPKLSCLDEDLELNLIEFPALEEVNPDAFYTGFEIDDTNIYLLDGYSGQIQEWYFPDPDELKKTISIPHDSGTMFTSFCRLDSGDFVLTDPFRDQITVVNKKGDVSQKWGKHVALTTGRDKSVYQTNPDGFCVPLRVKAHNNSLYINDFMNYRYHIMSPPLPAPKVTLTDFVGLKDISVFKDHEQTIEIAIESEFLAHFQVKTDQDWIQIKEPAFTSDTKELHITLLGSKMKPWTNHYGYLHISCDEVDLNNQNKITVDISVDTVGLKMQLTLDNPVVLVNGKPQPPLEAAPFVYNGRTMVPVRLIAEAFGAQIDYASVTREITIRLGETVIQLQTGNSKAMINGKEVKLDVPPMVRSGRTFVPLRFISEAFGANVSFDNATRTITILYPAPK